MEIPRIRINDRNHIKDNKGLEATTKHETSKGIGFPYQCQLEFGAIDDEEKEKVNFECMRVGERQSYDNTIESGND